ncbi:MAG: hypothetical protein LBG44_01245 [Gemmatimonadota bacterium]|jgi:hypothetical protein|nr:hypothetical protein [Gemmatimonadota bacterium]
MAPAELTAAQKTILQKLAARFDPLGIDRLWLFPPRVVAGRESGLVVLSVCDGAREAGGQRTLFTCRYEAIPVRGGMRTEERVAEEGSAPVERIERVIAGVLARSGADEAEPTLEVIEGDTERWALFLEKLGLSSRVSTA